MSVVPSPSTPLRPAPAGWPLGVGLQVSPDDSSSGAPPAGGDTGRGQRVGPPVGPVAVDDDVAARVGRSQSCAATAADGAGLVADCHGGSARDPPARRAGVARSTAASVLTEG